MILLLFFCVVRSLAGEADQLHTQSAVAHHLFEGEMLGFQGGYDISTTEMQSMDLKKKSVGLAAIYSLLLPGMGELYAGGGLGSGKYFLIGEGVLWLTYATFEVYGNSLRDDARAYAISRAGISTTSKDDQYYIDIGNFVNIDEYNEAQLRSRNPEKLYKLNAGYAWSWESDAARATYRDQRIFSEQMYNNRKFVVAAILINHLASAINAARSAISHNKDIDDQIGGLSFKAVLLGDIAHPHGVVITLTKVF